MPISAGAARSNLIRVKACADLRLEAAQAKAAEHGVLAMPVQQLLADPEISIVVNLTVPMTHAGVSQQILNAGKHAYSEKPLAANFADGAGLMELSGPGTCGSDVLRIPSWARRIRPAAG